MERILELRRALGLTQKEFAEKLGVHQPEVSRMESPTMQHLTIRQLGLIHAVFNVPLAWLERGVGPMFEPDPEKMNKVKPFEFALLQGLGENTAYLFNRICNATPDQKEYLEQLLGDEKAKKFVDLLGVLFGEPLPF